MNLTAIQQLLEVQFANDHSRAVRMRHYFGLLKTGLDGLATMGIVLRVEAEGLEGLEVPESAPDPLSSLGEAISLMQQGKV